MASLYRGLLMTALIGSGRPDAATLVPAGVDPGVVPAVVPVPPSLAEPELHAAANAAIVTVSTNTTLGRCLQDAIVTSLGVDALPMSASEIPHSPGKVT